MPKIPGERSERSRPPPHAESEAAYQRRAKEAREWFAQKKHIEGLGKRKP